MPRWPNGAAPKKPKPKVKGAHIYPTRQEHAKREAQVEQALLRRLPPTQIARTLAVEWQAQERTVWTYIKTVRDRWAREAMDETASRTSARIYMRASLNDLYARSLGRREVVRDSAGNPVLDPTTGKPLTVEKPQVQDALKAAKLLMDLDALQAPQPTQHHAVQATVVQTTAVAKVRPADLAAFLTRVAPKPAPQDDGTA